MISVINIHFKAPCDININEYFNITQSMQKFWYNKWNKSLSSKKSVIFKKSYVHREVLYFALLSLQILRKISHTTYKIIQIQRLTVFPMLIIIEDKCRMWATLPWENFPAGWPGLIRVILFNKTDVCRIGRFRIFAFRIDFFLFLWVCFMNFLIMFFVFLDVIRNYWGFGSIEYVFVVYVAGYAVNLVTEYMELWRTAWFSTVSISTFLLSFFKNPIFFDEIV